MFGDRLKELRLEKQMTQKELGKIVNLSDRVIGYYESGKHFPAEDTLIKFADYFGVTLDYLLGRTDKRTTKIVEDEVDGHKVRIGVDINVYPDGLTHEQVVDLLNKLKEMGMDLSKYKK